METSLDLRIEDGQLICNAQSYAIAVHNALAKYNYVVCSDNQEQAKKDKALLNKQLDEIKKCRIDFEKDYLSSWNSYKKVLMDTEKDIKATSDKLGEQLNQLDDLEKSNKRFLIKSYFDSLKVNNLDFEKIFDERWLNKSCKDKEWREEIDSIVDNFKRTIIFIESLEKEDSYVFVEAYQRCLDINEAKYEYDKYYANKHRSKDFNKDNVNTSESTKQRSNQAKSANNDEVITTIIELKGTKQDFDKLLDFINNETSIEVQPYEK